MKTIRRMILATAAVFAFGYAPNVASAQYNYGFRNNFNFATSFSSPYYSQYSRVSFGNAAYGAGSLTGYNYGLGRYGLNSLSQTGYLTATSVYSNRYGTSSASYTINYAYNSFGFGSIYPPTAIYAPNYLINTATSNLGVSPYPMGGYTTPVNPIQQASYNLRSIPSTGNVYGDWVGQRTAVEAVKTVKTSFNEKEIVSGEALNAVIDQIADVMKKQDVKETVAVDPAKLNFTSSKGLGQFGYLAYGSAAKLPWGDAFEGLDAEGQAVLKTLRTEVSELFELNAKEAATKEAAREAKRTLSKLSDLVSGQITSLGLTKYSEAKLMLRNLDATLAFLSETPEIQPWKRGLHAKTVGDLVKCFTDNQLKVVPALPGSEKAYQDLYSALRKAADSMSGTAALE